MSFGRTRDGTKRDDDQRPSRPPDSGPLLIFKTAPSHHYMPQARTGAPARLTTTCSGIVVWCAQRMPALRTAPWGAVLFEKTYNQVSQQSCRYLQTHSCGSGDASGRPVPTKHRPDPFRQKPLCDQSRGGISSASSHRRFDLTVERCFRDPYPTMHQYDPSRGGISSAGTGML